MGRTKTSTAEKKLKGTYRADRYSDQDKNEQLIALTNFQEGTQIEAPSEITDSFVRSYYQYHTRQLIQLHILSPSDIPELNQLYFSLQQLRQVQEELQYTTPQFLEGRQPENKAANMPNEI